MLNLKGGETIPRWTKEDKIRIAKAQDQMDFGENVWCKECNRVFPLDIMEVDHIKPKSKGGSDRPSNLRLLCPTCNRKKGAKKPKRKSGEGIFDMGDDLGDLFKI